MVNSFIWSLLKKEKFFKYYILFSIIIISTVAIYPLIIGRIVETITSKSLTNKDFYIAISILATASLTRVIIGYFTYKYSARMFTRVAIESSNMLYDNALNKKVGHILNFGSGNISHKVNNMFQLIESYVENFFYIILRDFSLYITYLSITFSINVQIGIILVFISLAYGLLLCIVNPKLKNKQKEYNLEKDNLFNYITDTIANIVLLKSFYSNKESKNYNKFANRTLHKDYSLINISAIMNTIQISCRPLCGFTVYALGGWYLMQEKIEIHELVMLISIATPLSFYIGGMISGYNKHIKYKSTMENTLDILNNNNLEDKLLKRINIKNANIEFKNSCFSYGNEMVLNDFNLEITPNQKVALIGKSGAGKSTIISLIQKFYSLNKGTILIDNQNISKINVTSLRQNIAYIPQDPSLLSRTIYENISIAKPNATKEEIIKAAELANAHEFIEKMPNKYDELVGERGFKLSGGQKQRIAIARAILKNAPIIIMDEATSALDSHSEKLIQESLKTLLQDKTCIIIAHRLSTIKSVDRIIVLENGKIVQDGNHKSLVHSKGLYKELWSLQQEGFIE